MQNPKGFTLNLAIWPLLLKQKQNNIMTLSSLSTAVKVHRYHHLLRIEGKPRVETEAYPTLHVVTFGSKANAFNFD